MVKQKKIFCNIELTKNDIFLFKVINRDVIIAQPGQDMFPKTRWYSTGKEQMLYGFNLCLAESTGRRNIFSFVKTIRFKILNWNSLGLDSNVVRKDSE